MFAPADASLGKDWASRMEKTPRALLFQVESESRPCIDIAGVASSILATPTSFAPLSARNGVSPVSRGRRMVTEGPISMS